VQPGLEAFKSDNPWGSSGLAQKGLGLPELYSGEKTKFCYKQPLLVDSFCENSYNEAKWGGCCADATRIDGGNL
jgi:hypothetical protein